MPEPFLKVEDVHTYYGPLHVLKGVNYDLYEGEIVCLLGGNASGKSTTMKTVLGLVKPTQGQVIFKGESNGAGKLIRPDSKAAPIRRYKAPPARREG